MKGHALSAAQVRAIARAFNGKPKNRTRLAAIYRVTERAIVAAARRGGSTKAPRRFVRKYWTVVQLRTLRTKYPGVRTDELAAELGMDLDATYRMAAKLGLKKSREYLASEACHRNKQGGNSGSFKKGIVPHNKGKKMPPGWSPGRMRETQFKKGGKNANWMPIGAERDIDGFLYVKVADVPYVAYSVNWKPVHVLAWERHHGAPVPPKHVVRFIDGNRRNFEISNLELVSLAENMSRNTINRYPPELRAAIRVQRKLERTILLGDLA